MGKMEEKHTESNKTSEEFPSGGGDYPWPSQI